MASTPVFPRKAHLVGPRIRELRKGRRLTQTELSEMIGVAQSDLSRMEQGEYKVGLDTLFKILQVFDLKMAEFFGEEERGEAPETRDLLSEFRALSDESRREARDFIRFKLEQERERDRRASEPEAPRQEPESAAPKAEEKP